MRMGTLKRDARGPRVNPVQKLPSRWQEHTGKTHWKQGKKSPPMQLPDLKSYVQVCNNGRKTEPQGVYEWDLIWPLYPMLENKVLFIPK